jgi:YhcH/YjgK/YiaL family protein
MILDRIADSSTYPFGSPWSEAFDFIASLAPTAEPGRHELRGDDMYATVTRYETRPRPEGTFEAHRDYVDIQVLLAGCECIEWAPVECLTAATPYDAGKDVELYRPPESATASLTLAPGRFAVFFPQDAHMPSLSPGGERTPVTKVVVKIRTNALETRNPGESRIT